jgi:hypothetical protein
MVKRAHNLIIRITGLYPEAGVSFTISYKVPKFIRGVLAKIVETHPGLADVEPGYDWSLMVGTRRKCRAVEVLGPDRNKRQKIVNWGVTLPYEEILNAPDQRKPYVERLFDAIERLLVPHGVPAFEIEQARDEVLSEVVGNPAYDYEEEMP